MMRDIICPVMQIIILLIYLLWLKIIEDSTRIMVQILLSHFTENYFGNLLFMASNEIMIHEKKSQANSHFTHKKIKPVMNHEKYPLAP